MNKQENNINEKFKEIENTMDEIIKVIQSLEKENDNLRNIILQKEIIINELNNKLNNEDI